MILYDSRRASRLRLRLAQTILEVAVTGTSFMSTAIVRADHTVNILGSRGEGCVVSWPNIELSTSHVP